MVIRRSKESILRNGSGTLAPSPARAVSSGPHYGSPAARQPRALCSDLVLRSSWKSSPRRRWSRSCCTCYSRPTSHRCQTSAPRWADKNSNCRVALGGQLGVGCFHAAALSSLSAPRATILIASSAGAAAAPSLRPWRAIQTSRSDQPKGQLTAIANLVPFDKIRDRGGQLAHLQIAGAVKKMGSSRATAQGGGLKPCRTFPGAIPQPKKGSQRCRWGPSRVPWDQNSEISLNKALT
jgi:hypothetical protein